MSIDRRVLAAIVCSILTPGVSGAQTPAAPASAEPAAVVAPGAVPLAEQYAYEAAGRRDPFLNLLAAISADALPRERPEGAAGLATAELSVRGVVQSRGALAAMVQGPDNRTYIVRTGDRLLDGTVKAVVPEGLVIVQAVNDPLSLVKEREVRRLLRSLEDGRP